MDTLLVLGAAGDLTQRLLLPGLGALVAGGHVDGIQLVGSDRDDWSDDDWRARVTESFAAAAASGARVDAVVAGARYVQGDATSAADLRQLLEGVSKPILYFALPPAVTAKASEALLEVGVPTGTRLVLEKPFGTGAESAAALNDLLARLVPDDQVHRVDHFLGMSTVLNILGLRFGNRLLEPVLNREHVESVEVVFDESLALEGRAGYYDGAGALIDMLQNHLLQVLSLAAMEPPATLGAHDVRDRKADVLAATHLWDDDPRISSRRARYTAGKVDGRRLPSYVDEEGVDPARNTETLAELVVAVDTPRWQGVPFRLRSGKALAAPRQEVAISFRRPARVPEGLIGWRRAERLHIGLGPRRLALDLNVSGPGDPFELDLVTLETGFGPGELPEYGEVLRGVLIGEPPLSVRADTAVELWRIVEPALVAWRSGEVPLDEYPAGSSGPESWALT